MAKAQFPSNGYRQPDACVGDHAVTGDCRTAALVSRWGSVDWLCLPHFSAPTIFAALLDEARGGRFAIRPLGLVEVRRRYVGDTAVVETTFRTVSGTARLTDMLTVLGEHADRLEPQQELLRLVEVTCGEVDLEVVYEPRPDFGRTRPRLSRRGALGWALEHGSGLVLLHTDAELGLSADKATLTGRLRLAAGQRRAFSLTFVERDVGVVLTLGAEAERRKAETLVWWEGWSGRCRRFGPHHAAVLRSAITLKLLTYSLSGAVVAAPTTSLPETMGGVRNWDYRFCWLRDASLTMEAFLELGYRAEAEAFLEWLLHATRLTWPELQVLYDIFGEASIPEEVLDHLDGYGGSRPVRIGNGAWNQLQLDAYGAVIMAAAAYVLHGGTLDEGEKRMLVGLGRCVCRLWRKPDQGIWEMRGPPRHHTHSKIVCWAALDCLLFLDGQGALSVPREDFAREREAVRRWVDESAYVPGLGYVAEPRTRRPDASLLILPHYSYVEDDDPRFAETFAFIERELGQGGLLLRYPPGTDGIEGEDSPFGICSFWAVEALARMGRLDEAERRFARLLAMANDLGLYAEEIDKDGRAVGNFPQAFTHVGLIQAALAIENARKGGAR
ncbi:glycoside hydrolase family 15 protein [Inquilinus limosus]|uniref:glycoside hydrolase family 15 protein n=1 Tax=Inquilinus limosus TaxID=171674 RepID=UPI003F189A56